MANLYPTTAQANTPWFQSFLAQYPVLAQQPNRAEIEKFLNNHPVIASAWNAMLTKANTPQPAQTAPPGGGPPPQQTPPPGGTTPALDQTAIGRSAKAYIEGKLTEYGLGGLGSWAWAEYLARGEGSEASVLLDMRARPEYATRFPGMAELSKQGKAVSEGEYIAAERSYGQQMRAYGLPAGFYDDPTDFAKLISGNVSAQEFGDRLQMAQQTALSSPQGQQLRDELARLYGVTGAIGAVTAYWIDPDKSAAILKQQFAASQVAAESAATGFGSLTKQQAELVGGTGISADQARTGFAQLAGLHELNTGLVGDAGDEGVSKDDMIGAAFTGDAGAQEKLKTATRRRTAAFDGGGGYAAGQGGVSGLGSAAN